jgi:hypothetical protein
MKPLLIAILCVAFVSCKQGKKEVTLIGQWEYEKMVNFSGKDINPQDEALLQNKGLLFIFDKTTFKVTRKKEDGSIEQISSGEYKLSDDKKIIVSKKTDGSVSSLQVVELSAEYLKVNENPYSEEYLVLKKIKP